ncbi:glucan endo-1,3-beta-glucosidase [Cajanus cajan]|uniref:glucan endo-1,3-beta-glucosidase n=1 Tax=Cajanus cajan TaxID=3821 RepID=UPI00098DA066|nr:glucan endo-1,3-beta-glucosidase [Cajanus cajan]
MLRLRRLVCVLASSFPPSAGAFSADTASVIKEIVAILLQHGSPININTYPYYAYASDPQHISLDYALFKSESPVVTDGSFQYYNLFDAQLDAYHAAFEKIGVSNITLTVTETGWPTAGNQHKKGSKKHFTMIHSIGMQTR